MFNLAPMLESRVYSERLKPYESVKDWEAMISVNYNTHLTTIKIPEIRN